MPRTSRECRVRSRSRESTTVAATAERSIRIHGRPDAVCVVEQAAADRVGRVLVAESSSTRSAAARPRA